MTPTLTGGRGRKYSVYALAHRLVIATKLGMTVDRAKRRGMYSSVGASGRTRSRMVYRRVDEVSCVERVDMRLLWSVEGVSYGKGEWSLWEEGKCGR
jgi:hypothetical protein